MAFTNYAATTSNNDVHGAATIDVVDNNDKCLYDTSDEDIRQNIWGPYYWISLGTGQLFPFEPQPSKMKNFLHWLPSIISTLLLVARGIYMLIKMNQSIALSLNWAYSTILFFLSLHAFISSLALMVYKKSNYFQNTIDKIRHSSRDKIIKRQKRDFIIQINVYAILIIPAIFYVIENYKMYDHDVTDLLNRKPPVPVNETARFRQSIFSGKKLFIFDAIIIVWGAYISACALTIYLLANRAICRQYKAFNKTLKAHIENGSIMNYEVIKEFESQIIDFLSTACYITNTTAFLVDLTFMTGIFMQISAQFALRGFSTTMEATQNTLFGVWVAESITLLVVATKRPATLQSLLNETTEMIWLDQGIWSKCNNVLVRETARNISDRIRAVDYASKGLTPTRAANIVFNAVLLIIPFFIDILAAYKYVPTYQRTELNNF